MKTYLRLVIVVCALTVFLLSGCGGTAETPEVAGVSAQPTTAPDVVETIATAEPVATVAPTPVPDVSEDPAAAVVLEMVARANAEDYAGAAELVADDMMAYFIGMPPTGMEIYWGKEQFQTFLEACCTGQHFEWEVTPVSVHDGVVFAEAKTWMDFTRELGVAPNTFNEVFAVRDGKIALYSSTMTEEALAKFRGPLGAVMPEAFAVPPPGDEPPVSEVTITLANNTCAYDGPYNLKAGELIVNVDVEDQNWEKYAVSFFTVDEGKDIIDLMASTAQSSPPSWMDMVFIKEIQSGASETYNGLYIEEGQLYMVCWAGWPDTPIGNAGPFYVQP